MYPSNNLFLKKYLDAPILAICNSIAFGDGFLKYIRSNIFNNKRFYKICLICLSVLGVFFIMGYNTSMTVIDYLRYNEKIMESKLSKTVSQLNAETSEKLTYKSKLFDIIYNPDYMRFTAYKEANVMIPRNFNMDHLKIMFREADKNEIPYSIMFRLIDRECRYIEGLTSGAGAHGYMQVMPQTRDIYRKIINTSNYEPIEENIIIGTRMLKDMYDIYIKSNNNKTAWKLALAAYNAGPGNVEKYKGVPPFVETQDYVKYIIQGL